MFHNFKEGSLVRVISLPWYKYGGSKVLVGDLVTIHGITKQNYNYNYRFVILKELLEISPHHNIGMKHLKPTGLRVIPSRNKREGKARHIRFNGIPSKHKE